MVKRQLTIGGIDPTSFLAEELALPVLADVAMTAWVRDALDQAVVHRKGVAVVAEKGAGKSFALTRLVLPDFDSGEDAARSADAAYVRRRIQVVQSPRSRKAEELIGYVWRQVTGEDMVLTKRGKSKGQDLLTQELIEELVGFEIAALVFDEAEKLHDAGLMLIRDIVSMAEQRMAGRVTGERHRASGIGVLFLGTPEFGARLAKTEEAGRRWLNIIHVDSLTPAEAAATYARLLPAFAKQSKRIGADRWEEFIRLRVAMDRRMPIHRLDMHVRTYVRRMVLENSNIRSVADVPYDETMFTATLAELATRQTDEDA